jgi:hypothetical protein
MDSKPFYESKVFWFNLLFGLTALAGVFGFADFQPSEDVVEIVAVLVAAVNIALRLITKQPVTLK